MPRTNHEQRLRDIAENMDKLREQQKRAIRAAAKAHVPMRKIAKDSHTSTTTIHRMLKENSKAHARKHQS